MVGRQSHDSAITKSSSSSSSSSQSQAMKRALAERAKGTTTTTTATTTSSSSSSNTSSIDPTSSTASPSSPTIPQHSTKSNPNNNGKNNNSNNQMTPDRAEPSSSPATESNNIISQTPTSIQSTITPPITTPSSTPTPLKRPRNSTTSTPSTPTPTTKRKKRQRHPSPPTTLSSSSDEDNSDPHNTAYYLRHQNRALAAELLGLKKSMAVLREESEVRAKEWEEAGRMGEECLRLWRGGVAGLLMVVKEEIGEEMTNPPVKKDTPQCSPSTTPQLLSTLHSLSQTLQSSQPSPTHTLSNHAQHLHSTITSWIKSTHAKASQNTLQVSDLHQHIAELENRIASQTELMETARRERDEAIRKEMRLSRVLFRLCAGRFTLQDVKKNVANDPRWGESEAALDMVMSTSLGSEVTTTDVEMKPEVVRSGENGGVEKCGGGDKRYTELEAVAEERDKRIQELLEERKAHMKQINELLPSNQNSSSTSSSSSLTTIPESSIKSSEPYIKLQASLTSSLREISSLQDKIKYLSSQWQQSKANTLLAQKTLDEMQQRHDKRYAELSPPTLQPQSLTKQIVELDHKLHQSLEAASHAESLRTSLFESRKMNESLEHKVSELRAKYAAATANKPRGSDNPHRSSSSSSSRAETSYERLKSDFRKTRKELAAANLSKENYKAKLDRCEKERESFAKANKRLLIQSSEKEEMNTKSLSTILHLKQLTELKEKDIAVLEKKLKTVEQLALAARLTQHAKKKVEEETIGKDQEMHDKMEKMDKSLVDCHKEKDEVEAIVNRQRTTIDDLEKQLDVVRKRCDELCQKETSLQKMTMGLREKVAVLTREVEQQQTRLSKVAKGGAMEDSIGTSSASTGGFTVEQLNAHVSVLKGRLACPVCNHREKECILLRCRHMFCKHCIDVKIKNRSRKCPACAQRFDMKDVCDVWL